jgi:hypothetical protein
MKKRSSENSNPYVPISDEIQIDHTLDRNPDSIDISAIGNFEVAYAGYLYSN